MPSLEQIVHEWHMEQPSPREPSISVGDLPVATRLATFLKFGSGHASPQEASLFWREFKQMNDTLTVQKKMPLGPEEFEHLSQQMARSSFAYHGRPPTMYEMTRLRDANPKDIHDYFGSLPDEHYPTVSAADMAKALHAARPWSQQYLSEEPTKLDAAYLHSSGQSPSDYYSQRANQGGSDNQVGPYGELAGAGDAGGRQASARASDPRLAAGAAAAGGGQGVPPR
jgi:hypothetical protein